MDRPIKCSCGKVTGTAHNLSARATNHVLCSCKSCQAYAHYLGRTADMLDDNGDSHIFQMNLHDFNIETGHDQLACVQLTPDGPLRWFTRCCKTPFGNSFPNGSVPFLGVLPICIGIKGASADLAALVGPARGHVYQRPPPPFGQKLRNFAMLLRLMGKMLKWRLAYGKCAEPFFDAHSFKPVSPPHELSPQELADLYAKPAP